MTTAITLERPSQSTRVLELQAWLTRRRFNLAVMLAVEELREQGVSNPLHSLASRMELSLRHLWECRTKRVDIRPKSLVWIDGGLAEVLGLDWIHQVAAVEVRPTKEV